MANFKNNPSKPFIVKGPNKIRTRLSMHEKYEAIKFTQKYPFGHQFNNPFYRPETSKVKSFFKSVWSKIRGKK